LTAATVVAILGTLYLTPIVFLAKDPWAPATGYADSWYGPFPISFPFYPIIRSALLPGTPWTRHLKAWLFLAFTIFGLVTLWKRRRQAFADPISQAEWAFFLMFTGFCLSFNASYAYEDYPRYSAPVVPQNLLDLQSRLLTPRVILPMSVVAGLLSAASALNVHTLYHMFVY
jgi:hypothetical protein